MADEIKFNGTFSVLKSYLSFAVNIQNVITLTGSNYIGGAPTIGTTEEALPMGDVATAGWAVFRNLDATNYVEIGTVPVATFVPFLKLKPGEWFACRLGTNAPYAKANTASCVLDYKIFAT